MAQVRERHGARRTGTAGPEGSALVRLIEGFGRQAWTDPVADVLQGAAKGFYRVTGAPGRVLKNFLHGTWLAHPLHAVMTDVAIGAWTMALVLDIATAAGSTAFTAATRLLVWIGLLGALAALVTGLTDFQHVDRTPRRIGVVHGLVNVTATILYAVSLGYADVATAGVARGLRFVGFLVLLAGSHLGGHLVYAHRIGVTHAWDKAAKSPPEEFVPVIRSEDLADGEPRRVDADGVPVLLVRRAGHIYALGDVCAHLGCSLAEGKVQERSIICPCHGSRFDLADGRVLDGPATLPQPVYDTRASDGQIEVRRRG